MTQVHFFKNRSGKAVRFPVKAIRGNYDSHLKKASWILVKHNGHFICNIACHADAVIFEFSTASTAKTLAGSPPNRGKATCGFNASPATTLPILQFGRGKTGWIFYEKAKKEAGSANCQTYCKYRVVAFCSSITNQVASQINESRSPAGGRKDSNVPCQPRSHTMRQRCGDQAAFDLSDAKAVAHHLVEVNENLIPQKIVHLIFP